MPHPLVRALAWVWTHPRLGDYPRSLLMWGLNAKVMAGVTGIVVRESGEVLLVRHAYRRRYPWALPGGWMERQETPDAALQREMREETGLEIRVRRLVSVRTFQVPRLDSAYVCTVAGGVLRASAETPEARWCVPGSFPPGTDPYSAELVALAMRELGRPTAAPTGPTPA